MFFNQFLFWIWLHDHIKIRKQSYIYECLLTILYFSFECVRRNFCWEEKTGTIVIIVQINSSSRYMCLQFEAALSQALSLVCFSKPVILYEVMVWYKGITSASDFFNLLTDGGVRYEGFDKIHKNMDDILFAARSIQELEDMLSKFLNFCQVKNIKLKGSKLCVSECVEFGGVRICREELGRKDSVFIDVRSISLTIPNFVGLLDPITWPCSSLPPSWGQPLVVGHGRD